MIALTPLLRLICTAGLVITGCTAHRPAPTESQSSRKESFAALPIDYDPTEPYSRRELKSLASHPRKNPRRLMWLINRAGAEKDTRVRFLLEKREDILDRAGHVQAHGLALALHGYDFSINANTAALDAILADLAAEPVGSDADAVVALSFINEWDRSLPAIKRHFARSDGAGSIARTSFWMLRANLFPDAYLEQQASSSRPSSPEPQGSAVHP